MSLVLGSPWNWKDEEVPLRMAESLSEAGNEMVGRLPIGGVCGSGRHWQGRCQSFGEPFEVVGGPLV